VDKTNVTTCSGQQSDTWGNKWKRPVVWFYTTT